MRNAICKAGMLLACVGWSLSLAGAAPAAPTHQLIRPFEATVGGHVVSLPAGTLVNVDPADDTTMMLRHTLPNGSNTLLFIPISSLKAIEPSTAETAPPDANPPTDAVIPAYSAPSPSPSPTPEIQLSTVDGQSFKGRILRVEKHHVVLLNGEGKAEDLILNTLDTRSKSAVERWAFQTKGDPQEADPRVIPGTKFSMAFPELGASRSSNPAKIQIRIPENYQPGKPVPLALYFGGGGGTDNCDALKRFVDAKEWVLVAFPYPKNLPTPLHIYEEGKSDELIAFLSPMLERVEALLPNIDPKRRVVIGTSNGAHTIGIGASDGWDEFTDFFTAYVMHEGGGSVSWDYSKLRRKSVFVLMGEKSPSLDFAKWVVAKLKESRVKPDVFVAMGEGHGMGEKSRNAIREWIANLSAGK